MVVATPALLAILLALAFFAVPSLFLILWATATVSFGIVFVILSGLIPLSFKLLLISISTIPLAGIAVGLFVGANAASQFIIKKLPTEGANSGPLIHAVKDVEWKQIMDEVKIFGNQLGQRFPGIAGALLVLYDILQTISRAFLFTFGITCAAPDRDLNGENTSRSALRPTFSADESTGGAITQHENEKLARIDPADIPEKSRQTEPSSGALKQRATFANPSDDIIE
ncbi:hypothetical protein CPB84DRAFT_1848213 [Gymnopilus junonius]|uniref:Uncharacterized protein n=1 Tax=Gymnopilus junonius TaxID=109634 RepID=A0A9P5NLL1_GYMJU|nr:hypothetical protein CPB84DRAFT_1848213 [Gymnopilus junonius]